MRSLIMGIITMLTMSTTASAQEFAVKQLNESPRHHEWVKVQSGENRIVHSFVAYPEQKENALAVIVIHENSGLTDWVRSFTDQLAAEGFLAIAPDLLSSFDDQRGQTNDFDSSDDAKNAIYGLDQQQVTNDLKAVQEYITSVPSANGKIAVIGFCWGGAQSFKYAANGKELAGAFVFYGSPPEPALIAGISTPVYGFYGENDQRINATIQETKKQMEENNKLYEYKIYPGAGHAFMRHGDDPAASEENKSARNQSWIRLNQLLSNF